MTIPAQVAAHFILIESQSFGRFQVLFDTPPCTNGLHHGGQRRLWWSRDEEIGHLIWIVKATAKDEPVAAIHGASLRDGQTRPVEKPLAFGAQASREALPIASTQGLLGDAGHITEQKACAGLHTHH